MTTSTLNDSKTGFLLANAVNYGKEKNDKTILRVPYISPHVMIEKKLFLSPYLMIHANGIGTTIPKSTTCADYGKKKYYIDQRPPSQ